MTMEERIAVLEKAVVELQDYIQSQVERKCGGHSNHPVRLDLVNIAPNAEENK